jgi:hypothetical protein
MAGPDWYESSKKYPIPVAASYGKKQKNLIPNQANTGCNSFEMLNHS